MKAHIILAALVITLTIPAACLAAPARPGGYMSGFIGAAFLRDTNITTDDFTLNTTIYEKAEFDPGINVGLTGGFDFGYARLEGELSYKHGSMSEIIDRSDNFHFRNVDGDLAALAFLFNGFVDLHNDSPITPYVGAGAGFATLYLSDTYGTDTRGGFVSRPLLYEEDVDSVFAYQVGGGVEIAINRVLSLDVGYRYFGTSKGRFNNNSNLNSDLKFESHNAAVGFRVKF